MGETDATLQTWMSGIRPPSSTVSHSQIPSSSSTVLSNTTSDRQSPPDSPASSVTEWYEANSTVLHPPYSPPPWNPTFALPPAALRPHTNQASSRKSSVSGGSTEGKDGSLPLFMKEEEEEVERLDNEWVFLERGFKEEVELGKRRVRKLVRGRKS